MQGVKSGCRLKGWTHSSDWFHEFIGIISIYHRIFQLNVGRFGHGDFGLGHFGHRIFQLNVVRFGLNVGRFGHGQFGHGHFGLGRFGLGRSGPRTFWSGLFSRVDVSDYFFWL